MKTGWCMWYSQRAVDRGCPVFTFQDKYGTPVKATGVTATRDGVGYIWRDKKFVGEMTETHRLTDNTYRPHRDFYRYWW